MKLLNTKKGRESSVESVLDSHSTSSLRGDLSPKQSIDSQDTHLDSHESTSKFKEKI